jgi:predicted nicotinamide N-methyase
MPLPDEDVVRRNTTVGHCPLVPEIALHLADDIEALWRVVGEDGPPPYWAFGWLGGQALARYVLDHPEEVAGLRVLDLATGSGLVALAAVRAGAASVTAADIDPLSAAAVRLNAGLNDTTVEMVLADLLTADPPDVDVVLAGDVCYDRDMTPRVLGWLSRFGGRVLLGDPGRAYLPQTGFVEITSYDVPTTRALEGVETKRVRVLAPDSARHAYG